MRREEKVFNEFSSFISFLALICFDVHTGGSCETFDGRTVEILPFKTKQEHWTGTLGFYKGKPTAVGGKNYPWTNKGYTEALTENGWEKLTNHTR